MKISDEDRKNVRCISNIESNRIAFLFIFGVCIADFIARERLIMKMISSTPPAVTRGVSENTCAKNVPTTIRRILRMLEEEYGFMVLFCVEASSHTWGLNHATSDWDVKFVFAYPLRRYVSPRPRMKTIKRVFGDRAKGCDVGVTDLDIEMAGFDLTECTRALMRANYSMFYIIKSHIVYYEARDTYRRELEAALPAVCNWKQIATSIKNHVVKYSRACTKDARMRKKGIKAITYAVRDVLLLRWLIHFQTIKELPLNITDLLATGNLGIDQAAVSLMMGAVSKVREANIGIDDDEFSSLASAVHKEALLASEALNDCIGAESETFKDDERSIVVLENISLDIVHSLECAKRAPLQKLCAKPNAATLCVAAGQLKPCPDRSLGETLLLMKQMIDTCSEEGIDIISFPEVSLPGYDKKCLTRVSQDGIRAAEKELQMHCAQANVACVVGTRYVEPGGSSCFNSATVIDKDGRIVGRQHKMQLVPPDVDCGMDAYGRNLHVFHILPGVPISVIICHDNRFPELCRIPVLAGSRIIFYLSCEQYHDDLPLPSHTKWDSARMQTNLNVYRAQAQARAVENRVWLVKSNAAGVKTENGEPHAHAGSHGLSCIIDPEGCVAAEAGMYDEAFVSHHIDIDRATAAYAKKSVKPQYALRDMWSSEISNVQ